MDDDGGRVNRVEKPCPTPMALLRSGVPLSLLLDLAFGPDSAHVLRTEPARPRHPAIPAAREL
jgi:hypothetical protein